ncbi:MAG: CBS domain-containing protein [Bacteroidia bacterium]|nr:CBS domain-containing protein [Bacteroidia bacterium]
MHARMLISDSIPPAKVTDKVGRVMNWMTEFKVNFLPVLDGEKLAGIISEDDLIEVESDDLTLAAVPMAFPENTFVFEDSHIYEVARMFALYKLDALPVMDNHSHYLGMITLRDIVEHLSLALNVHEPGGIIVLEVPHNGYHLSEIGRICESNDAKVLSLTVNNSSNPQRMLVTLKLNLRELTRLIATFERFNYDIHNVIFDSEQLQDYRENFEALVKYLSM